MRWLTAEFKTSHQIARRMHHSGESGCRVTGHFQYAMKQELVMGDGVPGGVVASPMHGLLGLFADVFFLLLKGKIVLP